MKSLFRRRVSAPSVEPDCWVPTFVDWAEGRTQSLDFGGRRIPPRLRDLLEHEFAGPEISDQRIRDACRLALHDAICFPDCDLREVHSQSSVYFLQWSSIADAMVRMLSSRRVTQ